MRWFGEGLPAAGTVRKCQSLTAARKALEKAGLWGVLSPRRRTSRGCLYPVLFLLLSFVPSLLLTLVFHQELSSQGRFPF